MAGVPVRSGVTLAEYVALEEASTERHELLRGEVFAMAGGTFRHSAIAFSIGSALRLALAGRRCGVSGSDFRVRSEDTDLSTYPDVSVWCGSVVRSTHDPQAGVNPVLLVEVLSPSTRDYDMGSKAAHYRRIPSLKHLLFVDPDEPWVQVWTRVDDRTWTVEDAVRGRVALAHLDIGLELDAIYDVPSELEAG